MMRKSFFSILLMVVLLIIVGGIFSDAAAQCPMCRMAAESNLANGGSEGKGLNKGILYMLAMPYLMITVVEFIWYRNNKKVNELEEGMDGSNDKINIEA